MPCDMCGEYYFNEETDGHFCKEPIIILTFILVGINAVIGTIIAFVIACFALVYYNASIECKAIEFSTTEEVN